MDSLSRVAGNPEWICLSILGVVLLVLNLGTDDIPMVFLSRIHEQHEVDEVNYLNFSQAHL